MIEQVVLHLGAHKTASTFLQTNLAAMSDQMRGQGVCYANTTGQKNLTEICRLIRRLSSPESDGPKLRRIARRFQIMKRLARREGAKTLLISEENLLGMPLTRAAAVATGPVGLYSGAERRLEAMANCFEGVPIKVILYHRSHQSWLKSFYAEGPRRFYFRLSMEEFAERIDPKKIRFDDLCTRLRSVPGDIELIVRPFETLITNGSEAFFEEFAQDVGFTPEMSKLTSSRVRGSSDETQIAQLLELNTDLHLGKIDRAEAVKRRQSVVSQTPDRSKLVQLPDQFVTQLETAVAGDLPYL